MELISVRPAPHHGPPMPRKSRPRLRSVTIKGKEFYLVSVPQPGGGRRLRTFKNPGEAKRFYAAVQGELRPGTEVRSIKRSFPGAARCCCVVARIRASIKTSGKSKKIRSDPKSRLGSVAPDILGAGTTYAGWRPSFRPGAPAFCAARTARSAYRRAHGKAAAADRIVEGWRDVNVEAASQTQVCARYARQTK